MTFIEEMILAYESCASCAIESNLEAQQIITSLSSSNDEVVFEGMKKLMRMANYDYVDGTKDLLIKLARYCF